MRSWWSRLPIRSRLSLFRGVTPSKTDEVLAEYPQLSREDVLAAVAYAREALSTDEIIPPDSNGAMRFLADENLELSIIERLREGG